MESMGSSLKEVAAEIMRKLETGELPAETVTSQSNEGSAPKSHSITRPQPSTQRLTRAQALRLETIKRMILRYQAEKHLDPLSDEDLRSYVRAYEEHFTYARIPTERIRDVYLEAMAAHGEYLLNINDYLRAWQRIKQRENDVADTRLMNERGANCHFCRGTGMTSRYIPKKDATIEVKCPFHCKPIVTALQRRTA